MDVQALSLFPSNPEVLRQALAGYQGAFSLGVGQRKDGSGPGLILQVALGARAPFPERIQLQGLPPLPLEVRLGFQAPSSR